MDIEKLIFIILAVIISIFSMYMKSKKQKRTLSENEPAETDFQYDPETFTILNSGDFFMPSDVTNMQENSNIASKRGKKKQKLQDTNKNNSQVDNSKNILQNVDCENEISLLEDFEGSELQKAFLYSEIFKSLKTN